MRKIKINKIYKHFKGDYYLVIDIAINSETLEEMVIYRSLYEEGKLWARPLENFLREVDHTKYKDIEQKYCFEEQEIKSKRQ